MGAFKLGKMTFGSLFKKPETVLYPFEQKTQPEGLKGHIVVDVTQCILCGMCERSCSTSCITVDKKERFWEINPYSCIQCGYCVTVCPKKCLSMDPNYTPASPEKNAARFEVPAQEKAQGGTKGVSEAKDANKEAPAKVTNSETQAETAKTKPIDSAQNAANAKEGLATTPTIRDPQLETLLAGFDEEKAKIVELALAGR